MTLKQGGLFAQRQCWELNESKMFCVECAWEIKRKERTIVAYLDDDIARQVWGPAGIMFFGIIVFTAGFFINFYSGRLSSSTFRENGVAIESSRVQWIGELSSLTNFFQRSGCLLVVLGLMAHNRRFKRKIPNEKHKKVLCNDV